MEAIATWEPQVLLQHARRGDGQALGTLLEWTRARSLRRIQRRLHAGLRRKIDAEDVVQEVHLVAIRRFSSFRGGSLDAFCAWIRGIVDRKTHETIRCFLLAAKRDLRREAPQPQDAGPAGAPSCPCQAAIGREQVLRLERMRGLLSSAHRGVLEVAQRSPDDLHEVARLMRRSYEATKRLHSRAKRRWRELVDAGTAGVSDAA